jgi:dTMP kinase
MISYGYHRYPGRLFVVEGTDGSGKSTQLQLLYQWLRAEG